MIRLNIKLLGPPQARYGGRNIFFESVIPSAILYYLAAGVQRVSELKLSALFWPGDPASNLPHLQEALDVIEQTLPEPGYLDRRVDGIRLDQARVRIDLLEYQDLLDQAGPLPGERSSNTIDQPAFAQLLKAVRLWRSPHFLDGFTPPAQSARFRLWLDGTRRLLERQYNYLLQRLSDHAFEQQDYPESLHLAHLALTVNHLDQNSHYNVLRCLAVLGEPADVRQYYSYLEYILRRELDAPPSPRLVELYRRVQDSATHPDDLRSRPVISLPHGQPLFVGRRELLDRLEVAYENFTSLVIQGEWGIGKSSLLNRFAEIARPAPRLLFFTCQPAESKIPLQPFIELFRQQIRPDEWLALEPGWAGELSLLLPELTAMRPGLPTPSPDLFAAIQPGEISPQLLEAIRQIFVLLTRRHRLVLCFDDLPWADEATLEAISFLLERPPFDSSAMLLASARSGENVPGFETWLAAKRSAGELNVLTLGGLSFQETSELAEKILNQPLGDAVIEQLQAETGGNPLFLHEMLHTLQTEPSAPEFTGSPSLPASENLAQLIQERLKQINPAARSYLEIAALVGTEFDFLLVGRLGEYSQSEAAGWVEELCRQRLIEPASHKGNNIYRFIHRKIQNALIQETNPLRARRIHFRIAQVLEQQHAENPEKIADILARHLGQAGDANRAFDQWLASAGYAMQSGAVNTAYRAYERAEFLLSKTSGEVDTRAYRLYTSWINTARQNDDISIVEQLGQDLLDYGQSRDNPLLIGCALSRLSDASLLSGRYQEGLIEVEQALAYLEDAGDPVEMMEAYNRRGGFLDALDRYEEAAESYQDALAVGIGISSAGIDRARGWTHNLIAQSAILDGWPRRGLNHALLAMKFFSQAEDANGIVNAYNSEALAQYFLGNLAAARQATGLGIQLAERIHANRLLSKLYIHRAMIELASGHKDEAIYYSNLGLRVVDISRHPETTAAVYILQGDLYLCMEEYEQAAHAYELGMEAGHGIFGSTNALFRRGISLYATGDQDSGFGLIERAQERSQVPGRGFSYMMSLLGGAAVAAIGHDWERARARAAQVFSESRRRGIATARIASLIILGQATQGQGKLLRSTRLLQVAANAARQQDYYWLELHALIALDQVGRMQQAQQNDLRKRVRALLSHGRSIPSSPAIQSTFDHFRQKILAEWEMV